jgi:hypothetical protein
MKGEVRVSLEAADEDDGEEKTECVTQRFVKCSNKCLINQVINPKPVSK